MGEDLRDWVWGWFVHFIVRARLGFVCGFFWENSGWLVVRYGVIDRGCASLVGHLL